MAHLVQRETDPSSLRRQKSELTRRSCSTYRVENGRGQAGSCHQLEALTAFAVATPAPADAADPGAWRAGPRAVGLAGLLQEPQTRALTQLHWAKELGSGLGFGFGFNLPVRLELRLGEPERTETRDSDAALRRLRARDTPLRGQRREQPFAR